MHKFSHFICIYRKKAVPLSPILFSDIIKGFCEVVGFGSQPLLFCINVAENR